MRTQVVIFSFFIISSLFGQDLNDRSIDSSEIKMYESLDEMVVTAQYKPTHYRNAIHPVSIISKKQILKRGATQLDQILTMSPAIRFVYDPILGTQIRMRGVSSENVAVLIDGVPVIGRQGGAIDLSQISLQNIERIEIIEGPQSTFYGNNAAGGVINLITKKSQLKPVDFSSEHQFESVGIRSHQARLGLQKQNLRGAVYGRLFSYDQYPIDSLRIHETLDLGDGNFLTQEKYPWNPKTQRGFGSYLAFVPNDNHSLHVKFDHNFEIVKNYGNIRRPRFRPYAQDGFFRTRRQDYTLQYEGKLKDKYYLSYTSAFNNFRRIVEDKRYYLETMQFDSIVNTSDTLNFHSYFNKINFAFSLSDKLEFSSGITNNIENGSGARILDVSREDTTTAQIIETGFYTEWKYKMISNLQLSASARATIHSRYKTQISPSFSAKYDINDNLILRLNYSYGYRSPSLKELYSEFIDINHFIVGNPNLSPEISNDLQLTMSYMVAKNVDVNANLYHTSINNRISLFEFESLKYNYQNVDFYQVRGAGLTVKVSSNGLSYNGSLGISGWSTRIEHKDAPRYGQVFDMNHNLDIPILKTGINASINYRHVGSQPLYQIRNEVLSVSKIEAANMIDASFSKSFWDTRLQLVMGAKNVLNVTRSNISGGSNSGGVHGNVGSRLVSQGRSLFATMKVNL